MLGERTFFHFFSFTIKQENTDFLLYFSFFLSFKKSWRKQILVRRDEILFSQIISRFHKSALILFTQKFWCLKSQTWDYFIGCNHANETARHSIVAHRHWEENLGNVTKVILTDSFGFVARSLRFRCPNAISERNHFELLFSLLG